MNFSFLFKEEAIIIRIIIFIFISFSVLESDRPDPELTPAEIKFVPEQM